MEINLGYVAISHTLNISSNKTITYTNYQKLSEEEKQKKINEIVMENINNLKEILKYNYKNQIKFYRLSHNIIPLITHPNVKIDINQYKKPLKEIGNLIKKYQIRTDSHQDAFCVLNSPNKKVVIETIKILEYNYNLFKLLEIRPRTILHIGGAYKNKEKAIENFQVNFNKLSTPIKQMIVLENDDKIFTTIETLNLCEKLNIPMCLDYHHHKCNGSEENLEKLIPRILKTWKNEIPKMHFSSPKSKKEYRSHSEYINEEEFINFIKLLKKHHTNIDIMLECKGKDDALFRLIRYLKYKDTFKIEGTKIIIE